MKSLLKISFVIWCFGLCSVANAHRDHRLGPHGGATVKLKSNILEVIPFEDQFFHVFIMDKAEKDVDLKTVSLSARLNKVEFNCTVFEDANFKCEAKDKVILDKGQMEFMLTTIVESKAGAVAKKGTQSGKLELPFRKHFPKGHH